MKAIFSSWIFIVCVLVTLELSAEETEVDLLIVGGTESGCAAAVQAARMGISKIALVNDIEWLGGQFSSEGLGAIDENRSHGYEGTVPIPRSGIFRDVIDAIESKNAELYGGARRPGNTRVITTARPVVSEKVFRELIAPFEKSGQILRWSHYHVDSVLVENDRVVGVEFRPDDPSGEPLTVRAKLTIDASDWGDVIKGSGAKWEAGQDPKSRYNEPSASVSGEPTTDLNPITWCMILEQQAEPNLFPKPDGYDPNYFSGIWGWIKEDFAYTTRRLVDGRGAEEIDHPDILLINNPNIDYPLDVWPKSVADALEATEHGASKKNVVAMTREQREIVFADARKHTLKYYYHLQQNFPKFRYMTLSREFGSKDHLPPKPYLRESLRLVARHVLKEQEVVGFEARSNYATVMFPDAVFCWQFELDFHPTRRKWTTNKGDTGPWEADFRGNRRFGRGGTGRAVFPLRALLPESTKGLIGAQKNLGYTSIVSSSCRLHDQSIHAGQAAGAVAAVSLKEGEEPGESAHLPAIWSALLDSKHGAPMAVWPFSDVDPFDPDFAVFQQLALRRVLGLTASDTAFRPDQPAAKEWVTRVVSTVKERGYKFSKMITLPITRRELGRQVWAELQGQPVPASHFKQPITWQADPERDGLPDRDLSAYERAFNFTVDDSPNRKGWTKDSGKPFQKEHGFGWRENISDNTRYRKDGGDSLKSGFVFTRKQHTWECDIENGSWTVTVCLGDAGYPQPGQHLAMEGVTLAENLDTQAGSFRELST
ncbi:MAG: FAD-dependent oxidoreductase, partial [Planctomycetaceae bacterium]|nr:FAD-dependent oxidoreductase [Planctomycetaceae bacterium]